MHWSYIHGLAVGVWLRGKEMEISDALRAMWLEKEFTLKPAAAASSAAAIKS